MNLNSLTFVVFLAAVALVYYALPGRFRNAVLLAASYVFYLWAAPHGGLVLALATLATYVAARGLERLTAPSQKKALLAASIIFCVFLLVFFRYTGVFGPAYAAIGFAQRAADGTLANIILPLGIGFFTLQMIGYLVDVYRGKVAAERNLLCYALFAGFFPQVTAGPIGRAPELLPQFKQRHDFDYAMVVAGLQRFLTGALKKVVVADGLNILISGVYGDMETYGGLTLLAMQFLYVIQLYFDFAGYTDMALGAAKVLGFELRENFNTPYFATSLSEFWTRWHMSLSLWFRDYIYIPLGGSRKGYWRKLLNIAIIFVVSGAWHGPSVTFVLWGLANALYRILEELWFRYCPRKRPETVLSRNLKRVWTMFVWVCLQTVYHAGSLDVLRQTYRHLRGEYSLSEFLKNILQLASNEISISTVYYALFFGGIAAALVLLFVFDVQRYRKPELVNPLGACKARARWILYWVMALLVILFYFISLTGGAGVFNFAYEGF